MIQTRCKGGPTLRFLFLWDLFLNATKIYWLPESSNNVKAVTCDKSNLQNASAEVALFYLCRAVNLAILVKEWKGESL